jgi:hypothetical protein
MPDNPNGVVARRAENRSPTAPASPREAATIKALGLDRGKLNEDRLRHLQVTRLIIVLALSLPDTTEGKEAREWVERARSDEGKYAAMVRAELAGVFEVQNTV